MVRLFGTPDRVRRYGTPSGRQWASVVEWSTCQSRRAGTLRIAMPGDAEPNINGPGWSPETSYLDPYREAVAKYGPGFFATLWGSREAQQLRFDVMIDLAGLDGCTILDIGCGHGDFAVRLLERNIAFTRYLGIDAMPEMIEAARGRDLARCMFEVADPIADPSILAREQPDFACISGTLNTMDDETAQSLVRRAFDGAAQGIVFNFLSDRADDAWLGKDLTPARRFDTVSWLDWGLSLSARVSFTQDYLDGHDATMLIRH